MAYLGQLILGEWAKLSPKRVIFNRLVSVWSEAAREAAMHNEVEEFIEKMIMDVAVLFIGKLGPELICIERYYISVIENQWPEA